MGKAVEQRSSAQDSLRQLLALQRAFEPHLQQTEALFRAERPLRGADPPFDLTLQSIPQ